MNIVKHNPGKLFNGFFDEFMNNSLSDFIGSDFTFSQPSVNILESEENFEIQLAAPGLVKEDFHLELDHDSLVVSVKKESETDESEGKITRKEFNYTSFTRRFHLPKTIDSDKITAKYETGILTLALPKKEEARKKEPLQIKIK